MTGPIADYLARHLETGPWQLGQVLISGDFCIRHVEDNDGMDLIPHTDPHDAIEIARNDDGGKYRPLKTAPNLRRGWRLTLSDLSQTLLALDFLYPAAIATAAALDRTGFKATALRETLDRQTGMYAVVKKITDVQSDQLVSEVCRGHPGCLRHILWNIGPERKLPPDLVPGKCGTLPEADRAIMLYCTEACNLLVAAGRVLVKKQPTET